jgi:hypothetical protein
VAARGALGHQDQRHQHRDVRQALRRGRQVLRDRDRAQAALAARKPEDIKLEVKLPDTVKVPEGMKVKVDPKDPRVPLIRRSRSRTAGPRTGQPTRRLDAQQKIEAHNAEVARVGRGRQEARRQRQGPQGGRRRMGRHARHERRRTQRNPHDATTAAGVTALEKLMAKVNGSVPGTGGAPPQPQKPAEVPMADRWYGGTQQKVS